ncbi:MAG: hypothetical protein R2753_06335 [Chitinophagales bacterium]
MKSAYLSNRALKGLNRFGDIYIPKNGEFPSFSEYGGLEHVDEIIGYAPSNDVSDLNDLLAIFSFMPGFVLKLVVYLSSNTKEKNGAIYALLRQLNIGLRGIVFACYYAERPGSNYKGKDPVDIIGFEINRVVD